MFWWIYLPALPWAKWNRWFITVELRSSRELAEAVEFRAIRTERPTYNRQHALADEDMRRVAA